MNVEIIDYSKKQKSFEDYHKKGGAGMTYAGFECLNGIFQFAIDGVTDISGKPTNGKSEFALELLFYQSEAFGMRHLLYVPDVGSYNEIRRKLIQKHLRRSFRGYPNSATEEDVIKCSTWIDFHFLIATKKDVKKPITAIDLWDFTVDFKDDSGIINTCLIDSWKNLYHEYNGREDSYLDYVLSYRNELAENKQRHFMTIAHPKNVEYDKDTKKHRIPTANDISGGSSWLRNGKTIITVDWPEKDFPHIDVYFWKVKPDTIGIAKPVFQQLQFDWKKSRYSETIEGRICYAGQGKELREKGDFKGFGNYDKSIPMNEQKNNVIQSTINLKDPFEDETQPPF